MQRSTTPSIAPRMRIDLLWTRQDNPSHWVACDPLTARFFHFSDIERAATRLMTGKLTAEDIVGELRAIYPTIGLDKNWLGALLKRLQLHHLLVPSSRHDAARIAQLGTGKRYQSWQQQLLSPLAIRVPLLNPNGLLRSLRPLAWFLFHPLVIGTWLVIGCILALFVVRELLQGNWGQLFDLTNLHGDRWLVLLACYLMAKSLHELGHGLACSRYGAECHEMGLMLLCLAPCLYCDTTDSWKLTSKWQRAAIAAAGMYIEWILASLAAAVWLLTQSGTAHEVAASMMIVCSIGTVLINCNPLLKYDGYYILSDLWGVPNLSDQSKEAVRSLGHWALAGRPLDRSHLDASPIWLSVYASVSSLYRWFILVAIIWLMWSAMVPMGLGFVAVLMTAMLLLGVVVSQVRGWQQFMLEVLAASGLRLIRWSVCLALLLACVVGVFTYPMPRVIRARGVADFADKEPLFATQTAELLEAAPVGPVSAGSVLVKFHSFDSQLQWIEVRGQVEVLEEELKQLNLRSALDPSTAYAIPAKTEVLHEMRQRERVLAEELANLVHTSDNDGFLITGPQRCSPPLTAPRDDRLTRHPLDPNTRGATCERSALVGWFTQKLQPTVSAIVPEQDVKRLKLGMPAAIQWDSKLDSIGSGKIIRISPDPIRETPSQLIGDAMLVSSRNEQGVFLPPKPHYEVTLEVLQAAPQLRGAPATIQFEIAPQTMWHRAVEQIRQNMKPLS